MQKPYKYNMGAAAMQEYAAQTMMANLVRELMARAESEGYDVEWSFTGELILTKKELNHG